MTAPARARHAIRLLAARDVVQQVVAFAGGIVVARLLGPRPLGAYGIALFVTGLLTLFADLGLRTILIRQPGGLSRRTLGTCFVLHQAAAAALAVLLVLGAPAVAALYPDVQAELTWLLRLLAFDLCLRAGRACSEIRLERVVRYSALASADIAGTVGHHAVAVSLVLNGFGADGLAWATLAGSAIRTLIVGRAAGWPRLVFDVATARRLVQAGWLVQVNSAMRQTPHWINPTVVAWLLGPEAVGLLVWASSLGRKPLDIFENAVRVSLPHFARVQHDRAEVVRLLRLYVTAAMFAFGAWAAWLLAVSHDLVAFVYGERWLGGRTALLLYALGGGVLAVRWLADMALTAVGRLGLLARVSAIATGLTVACSIGLVIILGAVGVPLGQLAGALLATPWLLGAIRRTPARRAWKAVWPVVAAGLAATSAGRLIAAALPEPAILRLVGASLATLTVYGAVAWRMAPDWLRATVKREMQVTGLRPAH